MMKEQENIKGVKTGEKDNKDQSNLADALIDLARVGQNAGHLTLVAVEQGVDAAISIGERFRDNLLPKKSDERPRKGILNTYRRDAHRVVDVVADVGFFVLYSIEDTLEEMGKPDQKPRKKKKENKEKKGKEQEKATDELSSDLMIVEGIGEAYVQKLNKVNIHTCDDLLKAGATRKGRQELAAATEISPKHILTWVNHVDLFRIHGVGTSFATVLEMAGVDSIPELARRNPANLHKKMVEVNKENIKTERIPSEAQVAEWVKEAKQLPRIVTH